MFIIIGIFKNIIKKMMIQNPFASPRILKQPYNYQGNLLCGLRLPQMLSIVERSCQTCPKCQVRKKNHYCIEMRCAKKQLICPQCDASSIGDSHYMHDRTYLLPLLSKDIANNFYKLKRKVTTYHQEILEEITKMEDYLVELRKVEAVARVRMEELEIQEVTGKIGDYIARMEHFLKHRQEGDKLSTILRNVEFKSATQYLQREDQIKAEIIAHLNALKWPKDPQKVLKEKLMKPAFDDQKKQIFISSKKPLELNQIDANFRTSQEFYTQNLQNHLIEIKVDQDYISKPKFYQSFIHHFKNCNRLTIQNGGLVHIKTPLTFRKLKQLQFSFTSDIENQAIKIDNISNQISSFTFRKFRQQDAKVLKNIACACIGIKKFHLQFSNKIDLFNHKDLIDFLQLLKGTNLINFTLKIRTQNQVKRLYGYLSKFYKEFSTQASCNLSQAIMQVLQLNPLLTKAVIQGVKPLNMGTVLSKLKGLSFLMDYKIYYENVDLMTEVQDKQAKELEDICYKRKRIFYALAKASKQKRYSRSVINRVVQEMLI